MAGRPQQSKNVPQLLRVAKEVMVFEELRIELLKGFAEQSSTQDGPPVSAAEVYSAARGFHTGAQIRGGAGWSAVGGVLSHKLFGSPGWGIPVVSALMAGSIGVTESRREDARAESLELVVKSARRSADRWLARSGSPSMEYLKFQSLEKLQAIGLVAYLRSEEVGTELLTLTAKHGFDGRKVGGRLLPRYPGTANAPFIAACLLVHDDMVLDRTPGTGSLASA